MKNWDRQSFIGIGCVAALAFTAGMVTVGVRDAYVADAQTVDPMVETLRNQLTWEQHTNQMYRVKMSRVLMRKPSVRTAIKLGSLVYGVSETDMRKVAYCESQMVPTAGPNWATATGLFQFIDSTWHSYKFRDLPRNDPYVSALAAAYVVRQDGGWKQWDCKP